DRILGEVNNGGDMVEHVLRTVDLDVSYKEVHASRGKQTRAEPIAALYEQHRGYHVGSFYELEDQMTTPLDELEHDDRIDAMVWAATELMLGEEGGRAEFVSW
ncbi:MAG: ATP-binding protein, partial [Methyloceanibacter sp.]|nr:ATP-binding protein [Methyloceanibacter sp.]